MKFSIETGLNEAIKILARAEKTRAEVYTWLQKKGYSDEIAHQVLDQLVAWKYVDDQRVSRREVENLCEIRSIGRKKIEERLRKRGIQEELLESQLKEIDSSAERIRAFELIKKRYKPTDNPLKAGRFLYSRGYEEELVQAILEEYFYEFEG